MNYFHPFSLPQVMAQFRARTTPVLLKARTRLKSTIEANALPLLGHLFAALLAALLFHRIFSS